MYYHLCNSEGMTTYVEGVNQTHESLIMGIKIDEEDEDLPYVFTYDEPDYHPLEDILSGDNLEKMSGLLRETGEDHLWDFFDTDDIMSKRMYTVLRECGVDNIQVLPLQFINKNTEEVRDDYIVFNILDLVSCTSTKESDTLPLGEDFYEFAGSLIDSQKTNGALIFRKEISRGVGGGIFIHEKVTNALKEHNIKGINVIPTRKWQREP
ncbi:imm11 family protein [Aquimarina sp. AU58]|uniref:imm11 family protein n=1 Tax=Aquimarina sp. AU58 TaxID=1874112 RepID=UPI001356E927|nr:DUF1629 domain-containing protein [Aquimarina sp. AU58]